MTALIIKEIRDIFKSKTALIYFFLLFLIFSYSFYTSVDLYSKASMAAVGNPLYASGFEPAPGVFVPTLGGFFIIISLIAPFLLIQSISNEKKNNTICLLAQIPHPLGIIFLSKLFAACVLVLVSFIFFSPIFLFWHILGGHIPWPEISLLISGYFLYFLFVISISFFSSSVFRNSAQASIFSIACIMSSWFVDFGKEMNVAPFLSFLSKWTVTSQLNQFESGILSIQSIIYFILLSLFFLFISYLFFNFSLKNKIKPLFIALLLFLMLFFLTTNIQYKRDISESFKNSFSRNQTQFLNKLPKINIKVFLEATDSRYKDYQNDFLKKLQLVTNNFSLDFAVGKSLNSNYGSFEYTLNNKNMKTFSNSAEEIFMVLQDLSGLKIKRSEDNQQFKGYPLVVKNNWGTWLFILYLILFPLLVLFVNYKKLNVFKQKEKKHEQKD